MRIYLCKKRFFCTPLKRYIPLGAIFGRYENIVKLVMNENPATDQDPFNQLVDGFSYDEPTQVTWIYPLEPPPLGIRTDYFTDLGQKTEDAFGNVGSGASGPQGFQGPANGLPVNSKLQIASDGTMYLQNVTTLLWHPVRVNGPDGSVFIELGQNGVPAVP